MDGLKMALVVSSYRDPAIATTLAPPGAPALRPGMKGEAVMALQYCLARLRYPVDIDGAFGRGTLAALNKFRRDRSIPIRLEVDVDTLNALDQALSAVEVQTPAEAAASPLTYLTSLDQFELTRITVKDRSQRVGWQHPEIQDAYGRFVEEYWQVLKQNRVEVDCKGLAVIFLEQFRRKVRQDLSVELPLPKSREGSIPTPRWTVATRKKTQGYFSRLADDMPVRPGYDVVRKVQSVDPSHSMIFGVNVTVRETSAHMVARAATTRIEWDPARDNRGDKLKPEIPVNELRPGDLIVIDHTGDGTWDHTVNVIRVERDDQNRARTLVLAVGAFDDIRDADAKTVPTSPSEINLYTEEVVIKLDGAGRVTSSRVTYTTEPTYLMRPRYSQRTTLMELKPEGRIRVSRWQ
jgi:peptidoglycan hydrolase-like protein with peptidoglycan-binding domain